MMHQLLFNMMTALLFDDDSSLKTDALEVETLPEVVIEPKAGDIVSWKKKVLESTKAPYNSIVGLGMIGHLCWRWGLEQKNNLEGQFLGRRTPLKLRGVDVKCGLQRTKLPLLRRRWEMGAVDGRWESNAFN
jgi:hypothetical protein